MGEHSPTDRCTKKLGRCLFCNRDHACYHGVEFFGCNDCGKTWRDLVYEPTPREARYWRFLRAERARGIFNDGETR